MLVVTHGVVWRAFRFLLEDWTYEAMEARYHADAPPNCAVSVYEDAPPGRLALRESAAVYWE